jgi:hypothetical protein
MLTATRHFIRIFMRITKEFQVTLPREVIESITILPEKTDIEFLQDNNGRWYLSN